MRQRSLKNKCGVSAMYSTQNKINEGLILSVSHADIMYQQALSEF